MFYKEQIKFLREKNSLMQKDIASIINISKARYCFYENETDIIPLKYLDIICNYFNVSFDYIFNFTNILNYSNHKVINKTLSGQRLKEFRKENNLTLKKLGEILNTSYGTIAGYESGRYLIATPFLYTICSKYKVSADYLLGKIDNPKYFE
ncbi:MAG: helix-turn-helix domain-containing protein [Ruminococcus sp.]|nr:helix-turn-helix domain-containing protein [Ruminococcus sp.]